MTDTAMDTPAPASIDAPAEAFALAVPAALAAAVAGAVIWALVVYLTNMQLGLAAVAIGALVGLAVRRVGNGASPRFGALGGAAAALGWALGTVLCDLAFVAKDAGQPFATVLTRLGTSDNAALVIANSNAMDLLFLGIAVWEGYKLSLRRG